MVDIVLEIGCSCDMDQEIKKLYEEIVVNQSNEWAKKLGYKPIFTASKKSKIVIVGQAPGIKAQESQIPWNDKSGEVLRSWLGVSSEEFYSPELISLLPMDFYYPGKGKNGDLPPRKDYAPLWHPKFLEIMKDVELIVLVGQYAQKYYLGRMMKENLTRTVQSYEEYLPDYFPIVHPSPLNFRWQAKNPWFLEKVVPQLQERVSKILR